MKVNSKKIIVTGAAGGIGKELVLQLLSKGAYVLALDINKENLDKLKKEVDNERLSISEIDVANDESLEKFKDQFLKDDKSIDGIINNAGIIQPFINVDKLEMNTINKVMDINFYGPLKLTKMILPGLIKKNNGHIVNVSSMGGFFPFPGQTVYGASKAALKIFTEGLYAELLDTDVKVTVVFPGAINTNIAKNSNVDMGETTDSGGMKMTSAREAARIIIDGMEKDKFQVYVGTDAKMMNFMYKFNPKKAIGFINKKMSQLKK